MIRRGDIISLMETLKIYDIKLSEGTMILVRKTEKEKKKLVY